MSNFVTQRTKTFLDNFGVRAVDSVEVYTKNDCLRQSINALKVIKDTAERGIAVIKQFTESVKDENKKQYLSQIVEHHRKEVPKRTMAGTYLYQ